MSEDPKVPARKNFKAAAWKAYYNCMATWHLEMAERMEKHYPELAKMQRHDAARFMEGVLEIDNKTHPNLISGKWK